MMVRLIAMAAAMILTAPASAQTATSGQQVRQAYGARLAPVSPSEERARGAAVSRRLETRVNSRISTRIERYSVTTDTTAALRVAPADAAAAFRRPTETAPQDDGQN